MKKAIYSLVCLVSFFLLARGVWAYDLTLTSVGTMSTLGTDYSLVTYNGAVPTLSGTASPSASVGIKINTVLGYATASTSGVWSFVPSVLNVGDNVIVLSSGTQSLSFTLRFNATASSTVATPAAMPDESELPGTGVWEYYIPVVLVGMGVFVLGRYGKKWMQNWEKSD